MMRFSQLTGSPRQRDLSFGNDDLPVSMVTNRMSSVTPVRKRIPRLSPDLTPTIFHQDWWLDIASNHAVQRVSIERDGVVIATLPYVLSRKFGLRFCSLPSLIHFTGPAFAAMDGPPQTQMQRRYELTRDLLALLPEFDVFDMKMYHGISDTLAFQREGFKTMVQFTYEIVPDTPQKLLSQVRRGHRRMIRDAETLYAVDTITSPSDFVNAYVDNIASLGRTFSYDPDQLVRLFETAIARDQGRIYVARGATGVIKSGLFVMWDQHRMYNFMATRENVESSSSVLLLWSAIRDAATNNLIFDFDGVYNVGQVQYFAGFGGYVTPRFILTKKTKFARLLYVAQGLFREKEQIY